MRFLCRAASRPWNLDYCATCWNRFDVRRAGAWTGNRSHEYPELCNCKTRRDGTKWHENCKACGPHCPKCATALEARTLEIRKAYRGW